MILEFGKNKIKSIQRYNILEIIADEDRLYDIGLGISPEQLNTLKKNNLSPIISLKNSFHINRSIIQKKFSSFIKHVPNPIVLFSEETALGYPLYVDLVKNKFSNNNSTLVTTEFQHIFRKKQL